MKTIWQEILNWCALLARNRYVRALEADVARLRAENRALVNSLLGTAGMALAITSTATADLPNHTEENLRGAIFLPSHAGRMRSQRPIDLPFFLTGVPKAQIVRTRRTGPIPARSCESEREDVLVRDSIVGIEETAHPPVETNDLYLRGLSQKEDSMESAISRLLETYEKGKVSRRDLVQGLVLLAASPDTMSAAGFQGNTINHVSLDVSDLERSTDFYQRTFGCPVHKRQGDNQVFFGTNFFVLRPGKPAGRIGHVAIGVENFSQDSVTADLKARGVNPIDSGQGGIGEGFHVVDPDGFTLQIVSASNRGRG